MTPCRMPAGRFISGGLRPGPCFSGNMIPEACHEIDPEAPLARCRELSSLPVPGTMDETGGRAFCGHVLSIGLADPSYGADEGIRIALVCEPGTGVLVPVALDKTQMPQMRVGDHVMIHGWPECLSQETASGRIEMGVLAALDAHPV